jgi:hypothetical protein
MCQFAAYQLEKPPLSRRTLGYRACSAAMLILLCMGLFSPFLFSTLQRGQARATAWGNTISISVPERPPVLI